MASRSAGLLLYRTGPAGLEVLLLHMGGPLWATKDEAAWTLAKGEYDPDEAPDEAAEREFAEELGVPAPGGRRIYLGEVRQSGGKRTRAWAVAGDFDVATLRSNTFEMQWPPRSGRMASFPEVDRAEWMSLDAARTRIVRSLAPLIDRLAEALD